MSQVTSSNPITSVSQPATPPPPPTETFPTKLTLDLRGTRFEIDREMLMSLPESILIVMFPNGLILGRSGGVVDYEEEEEEPEEDNTSEESMSMEDQVIYVDFDPQCLEYILNFYKTAQEDSSANPGSSSSTFPHSPQNPLYNKQAIIVLREELDYFTIPKKSKSGETEGNSPAPASNGNDAMELSEMKPAVDIFELKLECGAHLLQQKKIFTALQRNVNKENNVAEQHLIDMLCVSGFSRDDEWGYRNIEPQKCSIVSIALVMLKTTGQSNQMATAQKLLLFWRKPARKCWWDGLEVTIGSDKPSPVRLWCRRTWTLELALV